jgi:rubrerythrin
MIIDYEDDGVIRWERNGEKKHAELIDLIEAYEAEPTKHGRWSEKHYCSNLTGYDYAVICSECEKPTYRQFAEPTPDYCPNCGAKMDLIGEDKSHPFAESVMMGMDGGENDSK